MTAPGLPVRAGRIDEIKGVAITLVILYHASGVLGLKNYSHGEVGVDIFLFISGLGLAWNYRDESAWAFLCRRLLTVLPRYWLALAVLVLLNAILLKKSPSGVDVVLHALCLHGYFPEYFFSIVDSLWYISTIVSLYGVTTAIRPWLRDGRTGAVLLLGFVLALALELWLLPRVQEGGGYILHHFAIRIPVFFLGLSAGCVARLGIGGVRWTTPTAGLAVMAYCLWGLSGTGMDQFFIAASTNAVFACAWTGSYLLLTAGPSPGAAWLRRAAAAVGAMSFELYLSHQFVIRELNLYMWHRFARGHEPSLLQLLAGIAAGLGLLAIAFRLSGTLSARISDRFPRVGRGSGGRQLAGYMAVAAVAVVLYLIPWHHQDSDRLSSYLPLFHGRREDATVTLALELPPPSPGRTEALLSLGEPGAGDIVGLRSEADDTVRIVFDHWGAPALYSAPLALGGARRLTLEARIAPKSGGLAIRINGAVVLKEDGIGFHGWHWGQARAGKAIPGGTVVPSDFSGRILEIRADPTG